MKLKPWMKKTGLVLLGIFVLIQFYQPARNISKQQDLSKDFVTMYNAPEAVKNILHSSCYDCHSNNTNYLWYDYIQPARMLVERHIKHGKEEINFNEWASYTRRQQSSRLERIVSQVEKGEMPLKSYTLLHTAAKLDKEEKKVLIEWINNLQVD